MVKHNKSGRFSFKEERQLLEMASTGRASIELAAARLKRPVETIRKKAVRLGISLKDRGRTRKA